MMSERFDTLLPVWALGVPRNELRRDISGVPVRYMCGSARWGDSALFDSSNEKSGFI